MPGWVCARLLGVLQVGGLTPCRRAAAPGPGDLGDPPQGMRTAGLLMSQGDRVWFLRFGAEPFHHRRGLGLGKQDL